MKEKLVQHLKKLTAKNILAVLFLIFTLYVSSSAIPQFLINFRTVLMEKKTFEQFIDLIDEQYYGMLSTKIDQPIFHNKGTYINFNGLMANILGQPEMNDRFKLKNGFLTYNSTAFQKKDVDVVFQNLQLLNEQQKAHGKQFLFVLAPSKMQEHEILLPIGYSDYSYSAADYLLELMDTHNISYLDLRKAMTDDNISYSDAFFVTDHHWTPETGFWAYGKILDKLAKDGHIAPVNTLYTDPQNFEFTIYEDAFLGSHGKRTGIYFAGVDDFCLISPKFDTTISVKIEDNNIDLVKPFSEAAYATYRINHLERHDYFNDNPYAAYGWSDTPLTLWRNDNAPEDQKVMLIGDSYGNIPFSFMSLYFTACDELDMRHFTDNFAEYYENNLPDHIILLVTTNSLKSGNTTFPFFPEAE